MTFRESQPGQTAHEEVEGPSVGTVRFAANCVDLPVTFNSSSDAYNYSTMRSYKIKCTVMLHFLLSQLE